MNTTNLTRFFHVGLILAALLASDTHATDWAQFRGPNGSGVAPNAEPPTTWSETQNLKWKTPLPGSGTSSPIIVGGKVFVTSWTEEKASRLERQLVCVDRETGKILWSKSVEGEAQPDRYDGYLQEHGYASHTPASDGERRRATASDGERRRARLCFLRQRRRAGVRLRRKGVMAGEPRH